AGHVGGPAGDGRPRIGAARGLGEGLGDGGRASGDLPREELRLLAAARGRGALRSRSCAAARGAAPARAEPFALRAALPGARRALGVGQHEGDALVPRGEAAGARRARDRARASRAVGGGARAAVRVGRREPALGLRRAPAAARGAERRGVRGRLRGPGEGADHARRGLSDLQPPRGALRPPARGGLRRAPLEPRSGLVASRGAAEAGAARRAGLAAGCRRARREPRVLGRAGGERFPDVHAPVAIARAAGRIGAVGGALQPRLKRPQSRRVSTSARAARTIAPPVSVAAEGVSPNSSIARSEAITGSPSRKRPTVGAGSERSARFVSPWPPSVGTTASAAKASHVFGGKGANR